MAHNVSLLISEYNTHYSTGLNIQLFTPSNFVITFVPMSAVYGSYQ